MCIRTLRQLRNADGSFTYTDPRHCSVNDPTHSTCYLDGGNHDGFYESSPMIVRAVFLSSSLMNSSSRSTHKSVFDCCSPSLNWLTQDTSVCAPWYREVDLTSRREWEIYLQIKSYFGSSKPSSWTYVDRLILFFQKYFDSTNEPSQQIPFMYHYANRPALSTQRSRRIITEEFNITRTGLPGNDGKTLLSYKALQDLNSVCCRRVVDSGKSL